MSGYQASLFDLMEAPRAVPEVKGINRDALARYALLYTATEKGNHTDPHFMMTVEDAMAWCESSISRGNMHGTNWAYFWTSVLNFIDCYWMGREPVMDISGVTDNGQWDERIASLGLRKISVNEFAQVLEPLGVTVVDSCPRS